MLGDRLKHFLHECAEALFPRFCFGCKREGELLCESCFVNWLPEPVREAEESRFAFGKYVNPLWRQLIGAWKYDFDDSAFTLMQRQIEKSSELVRAFCKDEGIEVLIPLRLFARKERERGFDQSLGIAFAISALTDVPVLNGLRRVRATGKQADRTDDERKKAMQKSPFICVLKNVPENVAIVDDVYTTGATSNAAKEVLLKHGAKKVSVITLAVGR